MTTEKIFSITGKVIPKIEAWCKNNEGSAEASDVPKINYKSGLHVFTILFGCGLSMSMMTLIPRHDSILEPEYWIEIIFPAGFWIIFVTSVMIQDWWVLKERDSMVPIWSYLKVISITFLGWLMIFCTCNMTWIKILDYKPPMPNIGAICGFPTLIFGFVAVQMFVPDGFIETQESKRKSYKIVLYQLLWLIVPVVKNVLSNIFKELRNSDAQCVIAFLVPMAKRCTNLVLSKVMKQMVGTNSERASVSLMVSINTFIGFWVAITLVGARSTTMV